MRLPNIIFIFSDQHRGDWLGYNNKIVETPNLNRLAENGVIFENAYCNAPLCGPSRMSMLTGQHPHKTRVYINEHILPSDMPTFVHSLSLAGYETVLCGRMHFMGMDQRHGFQKRLVGDICRCYPGGPATDYKNIQGSASSIKKAIEYAKPMEETPVIKYDEKVTKAFEEFINKRKFNKPLFITVGFYTPHHPYSAKEKYFKLAYERIKANFKYIDSESHHPWIKELWQYDAHIEASEEDILNVRANYGGMISFLDELVGRILKAAEKLEGPTIVVYSSDHGDMVGDHHLFGKCVFYQGALKVPLIFSPLNKEGEKFISFKGKRIKFNVSLMDLSPTFVEIAKAPSLPYQDGDSLFQFLHSEEFDREIWENRIIFSELELLKRPPVRTCIWKNYKLIYYHTYNNIQLFDLKNDPYELRDLSKEQKYREIKDELLHRILNNWNPDFIFSDMKKKMDELNFLTRWGREVGMGKLELWEQF